MNRTQPVSAVSIGIGFAIAAAILSGISVFLNGKAVRAFDDSSVFTTAKNVLVGLAFVALLLRPGATGAVRELSRSNKGRLIAIAAVGGSIPFILFFEGLSQAAPANAAIIQKSLFIWVGLLALPLLGERLGWAQVGALGALLVAQLMIGRPSAIEVGRGEVMVLAATLFWSVEIIIARKALAQVPTQVVATARMALGAVILLGYLVVTGRAGDLGHFNAEQVRWLIVTAALLFTYVSLWYGALKRAPATIVTSLLAIAAPITVGLQVWDGRSAPDGEQLAGYVLLIIAGLTVGLLALVPGRRTRASDITGAMPGSAR